MITSTSFFNISVGSTSPHENAMQGHTLYHKLAMSNVLVRQGFSTQRDRPQQLRHRPFVLGGGPPRGTRYVGRGAIAGTLERRDNDERRSPEPGQWRSRSRKDAVPQASLGPKGFLSSLSTVLFMRRGREVFAETISGSVI